MSKVRAGGELARLESEFGWTLGEQSEFMDGVRLMDAANPVDGAFADSLHQELRAVEDTSSWFRWRNRLILKALSAIGLPSALWEVGAGNGIVAHYLQSHGVETVAIEPGFEGARLCKKRGVNDVICASLGRLLLPSCSLPAIGAFDVLEHLAQPNDLVAEMYRVLRPGGLLAVTVPAFGWLWSEADVVSGHYRRYRRRELCGILTRAGFDVQYASYHFAAAVMPLAVMRSLPWRLGRRRDREVALRDTVRQVGATCGPIERLADIVMGVETGASGHWALPVGTSILVIGRKL